MNYKRDLDNKPQMKPFWKYGFALVGIIFFVIFGTMIAFEIVRDKNSLEETAFVRMIFSNALITNNNSLTANDTKILTEAERKVRAVNETSNQLNPSSPVINTTKNNYYYEEQSPVLVHSETKPPYSYRQMPFGPPQQDSEEDAPYFPYDYNNDQDDEEEPQNDEAADPYDEAEGYYDSRENFYNDDNENEDHNTYQGEGQGQEQEDQEGEAVDDSNQGYPGSIENPFGSPRLYGNSYHNQEQDSDYSSQEEGRANQNEHPYDSYYRQWHYATTASPPLSDTRKLQTWSGSNANRDPYSSYNNGASNWNYQANQNQDGQKYKMQSYRPSLQQRPQSIVSQLSGRPPVSSLSSPSRAGSSNGLDEQYHKPQENTLVSVLKTLKAAWDMYQAFSAAWSTVAEHHRKQQEKLREQRLKKQKELQMRINSKKPAKFNEKTDADKMEANDSSVEGTAISTTTKAPNKQNKKATKRTTTPKITTSTTTRTATTEKSSPGKVEPRIKSDGKGDNDSKKEAQGLREKRQSADGTGGKAVEEGRYIKGDPLKGYYDFVITEGSYKFWAVFQVGTAILIIYSTFAAIYYSKVNPLVSDYDYTDYLGGGRSLSGGDLDFVDDEDPTKLSKQSRSWLDWIPRSGHSLKFILDAIDKLPTDHNSPSDSASYVSETKAIDDDSDDDTIDTDNPEALEAELN